LYHRLAIRAVGAACFRMTLLGRQTQDIGRALASGASAVLFVAPCAGAARFASITDVLAPAERERSARFHFPEDADAYVAAHAALRLLLRIAGGSAEARWEFAVAPGGRPLVSRDTGQPLHVSLSHCRGVAAAAVNWRSMLGIDVETERWLPDLDDLVRTTMTAREADAIRVARFPSASFLRLWTRKEAVLKTLGLGLAVDPSRLDVLMPEQPLLSPDVARQVTLIDLECETAIASLCVEGRAADALTMTQSAAQLAQALTTQDLLTA
jgi:phosphopantetheinyl transferase